MWNTLITDYAHKVGLSQPPRFGVRPIKRVNQDGWIVMDLPEDAKPGKLVFEALKKWAGRVFNMDSSRPQVAILSNFSEKDMDINQDGKMDITSGELYSRLILQKNPMAQVFGLNLKGDYKELPEQLKKVARDLEAPHKRGAILLLQCAILAPYAQPYYKIITNSRETVHQKRNALGHVLSISVEPFQRELYKGIQALQQLIWKGRTVVLPGAGGNWQKFNLLGIVDGAKVIGATGINGKPAFYSQDDGLITDWAQGSFTVTKVQQGYDVTGDGKADVYDDEVEAMPSVNARFEGSVLWNVLAKAWQIDEIKRYKQYNSWPEVFDITEGCLLSFHQMVALNWLDAELAKQHPEWRDVYFNIRHKSQVSLYTVDSNNQVQVLPDGNRREPIVGQVHNPGLASANWLANELKVNNALIPSGNKQRAEIRHKNADAAG